MKANQGNTSGDGKQKGLHLYNNPLIYNSSACLHVLCGISDTLPVFVLLCDCLKTVFVNKVFRHDTRCIYYISDLTLSY